VLEANANTVRASDTCFEKGPFDPRTVHDHHSAMVTSLLEAEASDPGSRRESKCQREVVRAQGPYQRDRPFCVEPCSGKRANTTGKSACSLTCRYQSSVDARSGSHTYSSMAVTWTFLKVCRSASCLNRSETMTVPGNPHA
jgi:hypothetical protein